MSVFVLKRPTSRVDRKTGKRICKYHVRWAHGATYTYLGSLPNLKLANMRKAKVQEMLAVGGIRPTLAYFKHDMSGAGRVRFDTAAQRYLDTKANWEDSTRKNNEGYVRALLAYWPADKDVQAFTVDQVQDWISDMQDPERPLSPATIRLRLTCLSGILRKAGVVNNPVNSKNLDRPKTNTAEEEELPSVTEMDETREKLDAQAGLVFDIMRYGGLRIGEARTLTWGNVADGKLVNVGGPKAPPGARKSKRPRVIEQLPFQPNWLPVKPEGVRLDERVTPGMTGSKFYGRVKKANGREYTPYTLRHVHATQLLHWKGVKHELAIPVMAERLGHNRKEFLDTYNHRMPPAD